MSRRACFYADEICARPWTDVRMDRVPLSLCFNSLVTIFPLVPSLSVFSPRRPPHRLFFSTEFDTLPPSLSPYCFCIFAFPLSVLFLLDNSALHLVFLSHSDIPRLPFFSLLPIFPMSFFFGFRLHFSATQLSLPLSSCRSFRSAHPARLPRYPFSSPFFPLCQPIVYGALLPAYSYARSPLTFQRCSRRLLLFLPSAVECRGCEREGKRRTRITRARQRRARAGEAQFSTHTLSPPLS